MSNITATVNNVSYPVHHASGFNLAEVLEARDVLTFTVIDSPGTAVFTRGMPVTFSDTISGILYNGYVQTDSQTKLSPNPSSTIRLHTITCMPPQYNVDKRSNETEYQNWYAGDIATDMVVNGNLAAENIRIAAALRHETSTADFSTGTLSGTVGSTAIPTNDGDLELARAGSTVTITESTTADFSTGSLTGVAAANNALTPTTVSGLKASTILPGGTASSFLSLSIWSGTMTIGTSDTLNYDVWISSTSPQQTVAVELICSDGTKLSTQTGTYDQNGLLAAPSTDLSSYAKDAWYTRNISLGSTFNGKTLNTVLVYFAGTAPGTYTTFFKNIYLTSQSGNKFLSTTATTTQVNPPQVSQLSGYIADSTQASVLPVFDPASAYRISTAHSIDAVKLLQSSVVTVTAAQPSGSTVTIYASYDGVAFVPCTNGSALPSLPVGSNVAGLSLTLKEVFGVGTDPTVVPSLLSVSITLQSAPNATKSDIVTAYETQAQWNTGTYNGTAADSNGILKLTSVSRDWNDNLITNQTSWFGSGTTQAASSNKYTITAGNSLGYGTSQLNFAGTALNFTLDIDISVQSGVDAGVTYRQISWSTTNNTFGYLVNINNFSNVVSLLYGSNSTNDNGAPVISSASRTINTGTTYHLKIVLSGTHHQVYFNNESTPCIDVTDSTYTQTGGIGLRIFNHSGSSSSGSFDNFVLAQGGTGNTWTSPSVSISSLGTIGGSCISWTETNTSNPISAYDFVQTSIDGGSTYQLCTNGGTMPNLTSGTNVSGKSVLVKVTLGSQTGLVPSVSDLVWRVLGAYPGSSGTRTTAPLGIDNMTRANAGSWGTAQDGQAWNKTGTGTVAISSNTATITNTTGDVDEQIGSTTATDQEATVQVKLSASTVNDGIKLRYSNATNYYKLALSTTGLSIVKNTGGGESTLATTAGTYSTNTLYWLRFRCVGQGPVNLSGKVWLADGNTIEPGVSAGVMSSTSPQWTVTASD